MRTITSTPPLSIYLSGLPKGKRAAHGKQKKARPCANPECNKTLTAAQIAKGYEYHSVDCGRSVMRARNSRVAERQ